MSGQTTPALYDAAVHYLGRGLRVIALEDKMPNGLVHPHGIKDAFVHPAVRGAELAAAFSHPRTTGIGVLTGFPLYVVDIDGEEGAVQYGRLTGDTDVDVDTWITQTSRGLHLYFASEHDFPTTKLGPKLDFKAAGGYVAAPPSLHPSGFRYEWLIRPDESNLAELPAHLVRHLKELEQEKRQRLIAIEASTRVVHEQFEDGKWWSTRVSLAGPIQRMRDAEAGERNNVLHWAACAILKDGADQNDLNELYDAALECGLDMREAKRTIESAMRTVSR